MNETQRDHLLREFEELFWPDYPLKVGRLAAQKAWLIARQQASCAVILEGVRRYVERKPHEQPYCHARTFLAQGRWMDERPPRKVAGSLQQYW